MKKSRLRCGCEFGPFWYGKFWELKSWKYRPNGVRNLFKIDKNLENITKTAPQIDEKSRLRFWSVFGAALGRQLGGTTLRFWDPKIPKQSQKEPKGHQKWAKGRPKSIKKSIFGKSREKGCQRLHPLLFTTDPFGDHLRQKIEKRHPKRYLKLDAEKV